MGVAALYDIHGNVRALEAVLAEIASIGVDRVIVGGDVVPGPMPCEAIDLLRGLDVPVEFIQGNGEVAVLAYLSNGSLDAVPEQGRAAVRWAAEQLTSEHRQFLESWPMTLRLRVDGVGDVLFCHATPRNETEIFTRLTSEERLHPVFAGVEADLVVCGHTHMQFDRRVGDTRVVNAGSVGMPFGKPGACWLLLDRTIQLRRTSYDLGEAASSVAATGFPDATQFAQRYILQPPSEEQMLEAFTRAELR